MALGSSRRLATCVCSRFFNSAFSSAAEAPSGEIGVQDFMKAIGRGVENYADKVAHSVDGLPALLQTRTSKLKEIGVPCKQRKMILRHTEKYRQGTWRPKERQKKAT